MTDDSKLDDAFDTQVSALKPDFKEIDKGNLETLLKAQYAKGEDVEVFDVSGGSEKSGMSSGIVVFNARVGEAVEKCVLRYAPLNNPGRIFAEYNIEGQFHLHKLLNDTGLPVPKPLCCDASGETLSLPGYVMQRIDGQVADNPPYTSGLFEGATKEQLDEFHEEIPKALHKIHTVDWQRLGLDKHCALAEGRTYIEKYLNWFWKTVEWAEFSADENDRLGKIKTWLFDNQPSYHRDDLTLFHGDANFTNYMFSSGNMAAILDWEIAGIGQPAADIAMQCNTLEYCRQISSTEIQKNIPTGDEWIARYEHIAGKRLTDMEYFFRLTNFTGLVIMNSILRSIPKEHKTTYSTVIDPLWARAEGRI